MKIIIPLISILFIASCSEGRSVRLRPADIAGVTGLETEEFIALKEYIASDTTALSIPKVGDSATFKVSHSKEQIQEFLISDGEDELRCRYSYTQSTIKQVINVETIPATDEEGEDTIVYSRVDTITPLEPTYSPILYVADEEAACNDEIANLSQVKEATVLDLVKNYKDFKDFLNAQIVSVFDSCSNGIRIEGANCLSANADLLRSPTPLTYSLNVTFGWMNEEGSRYNTELSLQFSPERVHFSPIGIFNYTGQLARPVTEIDLPYTEIILQSLGNELD